MANSVEAVKEVEVRASLSIQTQRGASFHIALPTKFEVQE
jgi:hypothetical protein